MRKLRCLKKEGLYTIQRVQIDVKLAIIDLIVPNFKLQLLAEFDLMERC